MTNVMSSRAQRVLSARVSETAQSCEQLTLDGAAVWSGGVLPGERCRNADSLNHLGGRLDGSLKKSTLQAVVM